MCGHADDVRSWKLMALGSIVDGPGPKRSSSYGTVQFHFREGPLLSGLTPEGP
ncbi:hypothetical protein PMI03_03177 [Rhizobium sp. AP16]|nr:hypothetical protein PMI03_03177 [Rhizobium sp. AP16]